MIDHFQDAKNIFLVLEYADGVRDRGNLGGTIQRDHSEEEETGELADSQGDIPAVPGTQTLAREGDNP